MKSLLLLLFSLSVTSCVTTGVVSNATKPPSQSYPKTHYLSGTPAWNTVADIKKALPGVGFNGTKIDLKGSRISGKNIKHPSNSQNENSIPLKIDVADLSFSNGTVEDIPGGIIIKGKKNTIKNITFLQSGEDFLSTQASRSSKADPMYLTIDGCKFYNDRGGDKSLQANNADELRVINSFFTGGETAIRIQESSDRKPVKAYLTNVKFENVPTAINVAGRTILTTSGLSYKGVNQQINSAPSVKIIKK